MPKLKILGESVNLGSAKIALTKKFYSLHNLNDRRIDYSNKIILPSTHDNLLKFNRPQKVNYKADKFNVFYPFTLSFGSAVLFKGVSILESANETLDVQLLDSSKAYFESLTEKINKLDFEADDFIFSVAEYDLKKVENSSVWAWVAVAMHEKRIQSKTILAGGAATDKLKFSRPLLSVRRIREKIQLKQGWKTNFSSELSDLGRLAISVNHKNFYVTSYQKTLSNSIIVNTESTLQGVDLVTDFVKTGSGAVTFPDTETIRIPCNGLNGANFRLRGYIESTSDIEIQFVGDSKLGADKQTESFILNKGTHFYDFKTNLFETNETYYDIQVKLFGDANVTFNDTLLYTIIEEEKLGDFKDNKLLDYYIKVYDNMPDMTQLELLKTVWAFSGAFHVTDNFRKELNLHAIRTVGKNSAMDFSDKLDTHNYKISQRFGNLAKTNYWEYDNDDTISEIAGRGSFTVNSEILKDFGTYYKSIFSASNDVIIEDVDMADFNIYSDTERINTINKRILFVNDLVAAPETSGTFTQLRGDSILNANYKNIIDSFQNLTLIDCSLNLNRLDFFTFKGLQTIYLDHFKSTFMVLEINNYIEGRQTSVKLLKIK
jgi:hypothetical protein